MGWPVNIHTHPGWTGATKSGAKASPYASQEPGNSWSLVVQSDCV